MLDRCLESIEKNPPSMSYHTYVVDNASSDGSAEFVQKKHPDTVLIKNKKNLGFSRANNMVIKDTDSEFILLLNSDCEVYEGSIDDMMDFARKDGSIGIIGPKIVNSDGSIQLSCRRFPSLIVAGIHTIFSSIFPNNRFSLHYKMADRDRKKPFEVDWVSGSAMMIRRKALDDTGILDEKYFMYVEDIDLCYQMHQRGWKVFYYPHAKVLHHIGGSSRGRQVRPCIIMQKSILHFYVKNYSKTPKILLIPILVFVLGIRIAVTFIKDILGRKNN